MITSPPDYGDNTTVYTFTAATPVQCAVCCSFILAGNVVIAQGSTEAPVIRKTWHPDCWKDES